MSVMVPETADKARQKAVMRIQARLRRGSACTPEASEALRDMVLSGLHLSPGGIVAGIWPLPGEIDGRPLLRALYAAGHVIVLPETPRRGLPLVFRIWHPGRPMIRGRFGTSYPDGQTAVPDLIFVPLLAFDRAGRRLGYGGGYYDRTLAMLPGVAAVGVGFSAQEVPEVPVEPHDRPLDVIATESEIIRCATR